MYKPEGLLSIVQHCKNEMIMKKIIYIVAVLTMLAFGAGASTFIEGLEDVPLPEGITQVHDIGVNFGNEEARFIEIYLESDILTFKDIKSFYQNTMPQLGWAQASSSQYALSFNRENETIEIALEETAPLKVRITLKSRF